MPHDEANVVAEVGLILIAHGPLAHALLESAEMIMGIQTNTIALSLDMDESLEGLKLEVERTVRKVDRGAGALLLVDLLGGTPSNAATLAMTSHSIEVVTGMNLGMVLEVMSQRKGKSLKELAALATQAGQDSIVDIGSRLRKGATTP